MIVIIISDTVVAGHIAISGETLEVADVEARYLIALGKARLIEQVIAEPTIEQIMAEPLMEKILADPLAIRETTERKAPEKRKR